MHLAFIDIAYGYAADRPDGDEALGGTTSAICFTARELVKAGIACTIFNKTSEDKVAFGVRTCPLNALAEECTKPDYSAFIFCGRWIPGMVDLIRQHTKAPLVAWMHESSFNDQLVTALPAFDGVSYVSTWQQRINQSQALPHWKQTIIRNAMTPYAATLYAGDESIVAAKTKPPILLFAGTVPRGVMHLPPMLDELRKLQNNFTVEIYCNTNPSGHAGQDEKYITWLRNLPNITHVGMVGQKELAMHMKRASLFVAPNPWPETSCIALIEAMAAGLSVVTTNRAALPETASGFARHIPIDNPDDPIFFNMPMPYGAFAAAVSDAMNELQQPEKLEAKLRKQIDYCLKNYQWQQRVGEWMEFVERF